MFDMIPFTSRFPGNRTWDPLHEFFGTVVRSAATDIRETEDSFVIETELPGYDKSEIGVSVKEGVLTIKAEHTGTAPEEGYLRRERAWETVERSFEVSGVDTGAIRAAYVNGVLTVTLPKLPEIIPQQHQIEVM